MDKRESTAKRFIQGRQWQDFPTPETERYVADIIRVDVGLLPALEAMMQTELIGRELAAHFQRHLIVYGPPCDAVSQFELFLGPDRLPLYYLNVKADIYVSGEPGIPFGRDTRKDRKVRRTEKEPKWMARKL